MRDHARGCPQRAVQAFLAALNTRSLQIRVVLELFAGSCRWARAVGQLGFYVIAIDTRFGESNNLLSRKVQNSVLGWIQADLIHFILGGFPCQSLSRARNRPGGPPALRNGDNVLGIPGLAPWDQAKIVAGNEGVSFVIRVARACIARRIVCILENPWTSWGWAFPAMKDLQRNAHVRLTRTDFCQWGTCWKKSTGFLTTFCDVGFIDRRCHCKSRGICSRTHRTHHPLVGCNAHGVFWTHIAEAYPVALCRALALMCRHSSTALVMDHLDGFFCKIL